MTSTPAVEAEQEYETCQPIYWLGQPDGTRAPIHTRIRVVHAGPFDGDKAAVATIHQDIHGRESLDRRRLIKLASLHTDGKSRKTGYRLVRHADGTPAEGVR